VGDDFVLTTRATTQAANLGHLLEEEWTYSGQLILNRCIRCDRGLYVAPTSQEIGGPALREPCKRERRRRGRAGD
jgi:hypothetical protein